MIDNNQTNQILQDLSDIELKITQFFANHPESAIADVLYHQKNEISNDLRTLIHDRIYND